MDVNDLRFRQRVVIEFVVKKNNSPAETFDRLRYIYGYSVIGVSSLPHCVKRFKDGSKDIVRLPRSCRPLNATNRKLVISSRLRKS